MSDPTDPYAPGTNVPRGEAREQSGSPRSEEAKQRVREQYESVMDESETDVVPDMRVVADKARHLIEDQVRERPYTTVLAAAGIGYVLGGGIPRWAVRMGMNTGSRMLVAWAIAQATDMATDD